jgi:hypothetical protein
MIAAKLIGTFPGVITILKAEGDRGLSWRNLFRFSI